MRPDMNPALFVAIFGPIFFALFIAAVLSGKDAKALQEKARARRMAEHQMNARLLRFDI